jgi:hypothetical protein
MPKRKSQPKQIDVSEELQSFREYLQSDRNEDAKRPLLYPLFKRLFGEKFKIESDVDKADIYIEGKLIVESKTDYSQWVEGFFQALHYHRKFGLVYNTIIVVAHKFVAVWKVDQLPEYAVMLSHTVHSYYSPSLAGKENAKKTTKAGYRANMRTNEKSNLRCKNFFEDFKIFFKTSCFTISRTGASMQQSLRAWCTCAFVNKIIIARHKYPLLQNQRSILAPALRKINNEPSHKKYFLSYERHENIFCQRTSKYFLPQPIS